MVDGLPPNAGVDGPMISFRFDVAVVEALTGGGVCVCGRRLPTGPAGFAVLGPPFCPVHRLGPLDQSGFEPIGVSTDSDVVGAGGPPRRLVRSANRSWRTPGAVAVDVAGSPWRNPWLVDRHVTSHMFDLHVWRVGDGRQRGCLPHWSLRDEFESREQATALATARFEADLRAGVLDITVADVVDKLAGRDLGCSCPLTTEDGSRFPCHADVLLAVANPQIERIQS